MTTIDTFEIPRDKSNKKLAEQMGISISEVMNMPEEVRNQKMVENFEGYVMDEADTIKGQAFYKYY